MVAETEHDGATWYECERCGLTFNTRDDAQQHEATCDGKEPDYYQ